MPYPFTQTAEVIKVLLGTGAILCISLFASCTHGQPKIRAGITNVMAKPDSHLIAAAVEYEQFREAEGINALPNGGVPKILDHKAKIYLCDVRNLEVTKVAAVTPKDTVRIGWQPWILGWFGDSLFFQISGQQGTKPHNRQRNTVIYRVAPDGKVAEVTDAPTDLVFQKNTGPVPKNTFVQISKGYDTIDVRTERDRSLRTLFRIETEKGELVAVRAPKHNGLMLNLTIGFSTVTPLVDMMQMNMRSSSVIMNQRESGGSSSRSPTSRRFSVLKWSM